MILKRALLCVTLFAMLGFSACSAAAPAAFTPTAVQQPVPSATPAVTDTTVASATATAVASATATAVAEATAAPTGAAVATPPPVISAENAANLSSSALTLPDYPQRFLWVKPGVSLPDGLPPDTELLAFAGTMLYPIPLHPPAVGQPVQMAVPGRILDFSPGLTSVASVPDPNVGQVSLYDMTGKVLFTLAGSSGYGASYSADGSLLAVTSPDELAVSLYNTANGQMIKKLTGFETAAPVYSAEIVPGNKTIDWIARATLEFQNVQTGQMGQKLNYEDFIGAHAFSPDGTRLALSVAGKLYLYTVPDAKQLAEVTLSESLTSIAFSPDGKLLASGYGSGIQIWDAAALTPVGTLPGPNTSTGTVTFPPDGRYLVSGHENNVIEVWQVK